jgi:hypothetical protein
MSTPKWAPGTLYAPGSLVQPLSALAPTPDQVTNGGFESGNTGWTMDAGFSIGQFGNGTHFEGTWSLQWDATTTGRAINNNATAVTPGQTINANCQVQQGASSSGQAGARAEVAWYDASDELISYSSGNLVDSGSNQHWKQSSVAAVAPAGAAFARFSVYAFRTSGGDELWVDNCSWDAIVNGLPPGLVFKAVQAVAGNSASNEPVWPVTVGSTVVDNEVTWEAVYASRVTWEATPILVSGEYEPVFPELVGATVADGTIKWTAIDARVVDAPQSPITAIAASKVYKGDDDIVPFSATANPLDWSAEQDAGYIPFGLNTYGATPVSALGLYRSNLVPFNSQGFQMWQIDEDPANNAILDAAPVPCEYKDTLQPVSNDLVFLTSRGIRNISIAGASTNLQAGYFGKQVDPLVLELLAAALAAGFSPLALFYPGAGQYWVIFGTDVLVLTMNGGSKDQSWSRYQFPSAITDWAILGTELYLRSGDLVWRVSDEALQDDIHTLTSEFCDGDLWMDANSDTPPSAFQVDGSWVMGPATAYNARLITYVGLTVLSDDVTLNWSSATDATGSFFRYDVNSTGYTVVPLTGTSGQIVIQCAGAATLTWDICGNAFVNLIPPTVIVTVTCSGETIGTPFEGYMAWPYLDFGRVGLDKMMEGFDIVADGTFSVSIGYSQKDTSLATTGYSITGDTLPGGMVPMPLVAPSFQFRLTFDADQSWEWFASNLYCTNLGTG